MELLADNEARPYVAASGPEVASLATESLAAMTHPPKPKIRAAHRISPEAMASLKSRVDSLEELAFLVSPLHTYEIAKSEFRLIMNTLTHQGHGGDDGVQLLRLAARITGLCGGLNIALGFSGKAERWFIAAAHASTAIHDPLLASAHLVGIAHSHLLAGNVGDVFPLVEAARAMVKRPSPRFAVLLDCVVAQAHAALRDTTASAKALDRASRALAVSGDLEELTAYRYIGKIDECWLAVGTGKTWLRMGQPEYALEHLAPKLGNDAAPYFRTRSFPFGAQELLCLADAQLALNDIDAAAHSARRAADVMGGLPSSLVRQFRKRFTAHTSVPAVQDLWCVLAKASRT
ncbi:hypothetical protein RB200_05150 [Streptomyces sp. PmtG]